MNANFVFGNDFLSIKDFEHNPNDIYYNTFFDLEVHSGVFSGVAPCEYDFRSFCEFVSELEDMLDFKKSTVTLNDICYGSTVKFEADKTGHIEISGEIFGSGMMHSLTFTFRADQTALKPFVDELRQLIAAYQEEGCLMKTYSIKDDALALVVFNSTREKLTETFTFDVIPFICSDKEYIAYEYFTKQYKRITAASVETVALNADGVLSYSIYPIEKDSEGEYIIMGGTDRYVGIGVREKKRVAVKDIL